MGLGEPAERGMPAEGEAQPAAIVQLVPPPTPSAGRLGRWVARSSDVTAANLLSGGQWLALLALGVTLACLATLLPNASAVGAWLFGVALFLGVAAWRVALTLLGHPPEAPAPLPDLDLPKYTVVCPLYREAGMVAALLRAIEALDYPRDRLEVLLALEADDAATQAAAAELDLPGHVRVVIAPPGSPKTKPRACNVALNHAHGQLLVIYDAEDRPHPGQLREAAARFAAADDTLVCLQAPLRVLPRQTILQRQFAMEYAAQFDVALYGMTRLGLPFPLGGTSNHFRIDRLRDVGGWDPWNVTEDADLGFRFASRGWRIGALRLPTTESAPETARDWLTQRTRWLKGFLQTLIVWTRRPHALGPRGAGALFLTLGVSSISALVQAPMVAWMVTWTLGSALLGRFGDFLILDGIVLITSWWSFCLMARRGARLAGFKTTSWDYVCAFLYWPLLTIAALRAWRDLIWRPFLWEKTPHTPPTEPIDWTKPDPAD